MEFKFEIKNSLQKKNESKVFSIDNSTEIVALRIISVGVIISCYIYFKYTIKSAAGFIQHKNLNFLFPLVAAAFAFANNANDIFHYIYHPEDCYIFYSLFKASATLNWAPLSWLKTFRLSLISKIYLSKPKFYFITVISAILSTLYCVSYFLNLNQFSYELVEFTGCGVTNNSKYIYQVMAFDIVDSIFSLGAISIIIYNAIKSLRELNTKNEKLNNLVSEGIFELIIITIAKIIIYPLIAITSYQPSFDIFWDVLSVIIICFSYRMVNFPYQNNPKEKNLGRKFFSFVGSKVKSIKTMISTSTNNNDIDYNTFNFNNKTDDIDNNKFHSIKIDETKENPSLHGINI